VPAAERSSKRRASSSKAQTCLNPTSAGTEVLLYWCQVMCKVQRVPRSLPALHLRRSPLAFVLAQVRISPVLIMEEFVPRIQERLRHNGYPWYSVAQLQEFVLGGGQALPEVKSSARWLFQAEDKRTAVVLSESFVALETTSYETFDSFTEELQGVLTVIGELAEIPLSERIGLRYLDVIRPLQDDETLDDYLARGIQGLDTRALQSVESHSRYELRGRTPHGEIRVRCVRAFGEPPLPSDLSPIDLESPLMESGETEVAVLDFDHFSVETRAFDPDELLRGCWELHDAIDRAFRECTTKHARTRWEAQPA
jgi:uncharacterized protein (TIGR04255 family)